MWNEEQLASVAGISGEDGRGSFYNPPAIRMQGKTGEVTRYTKKGDEKVNEVLKLPISVVFLKHRSQIVSAYVPSKTPKPSYFSTEFDAPNELVSVMRRSVGESKPDTIATGLTIEKAKEFIFQQSKKEAKHEKVIYVLYNGEVNKLYLKGGSMSPYFDYLKEVKESGSAHSFMVNTKLTDSGLTTNEAGMEFHHFVFTNTGTSDPALVAPKMKEVDAGLKASATTNAKSAPSAEESSLNEAWAAIGGEPVLEVD